MFVLCDLGSTYNDVRHRSSEILSCARLPLSILLWNIIPAPLIIPFFHIHYLHWCNLASCNVSMVSSWSLSFPHTSVHNRPCYMWFSFLFLFTWLSISASSGFSHIFIVLLGFVIVLLLIFLSSFFLPLTSLFLSDFPHVFIVFVVCRFIASSFFLS